MYSLFARVPAGLSEMKINISNYILSMGAEINQQINTDLKSKSTMEKGSGNIAICWVLDVLTLQEKFDKILDLAAAKDKSFQTAFNEAFEKFINDNQKSAEFISLFIDENLKKGLKGVSKCNIKKKEKYLKREYRNPKMKWMMYLTRQLHCLDFYKIRMYLSVIISNI